LKSIENKIRSDEMAEILFATVIASAAVLAIVWLLEDYKKAQKRRQTKEDHAALLGVVLPNKKDKKDE
jgi:hypothetical protein